MTTKDGQDYFTDDARQTIIDKLILPTLRGGAGRTCVKGKLVLMPPGQAGRRRWPTTTSPATSTRPAASSRAARTATAA